MGGERVIVFGAGDLGASQRCIFATRGIEVIGWADDRVAVGTEIGGLPVLGNGDELPRLLAAEGATASFAIGYNRFDLRARRFEELRDAGVAFTRCVHASAVVDPSAALGAGVVLFAGAVVDHGCVLEDNTLLNTGAVVAHDTTIGSHAFLSPGVALAGFVAVGRCALVGLGSRVIERVRIGRGATVAAGAVVLEDVPEFALVAGVPAVVKRVDQPFATGGAR